MSDTALNKIIRYGTTTDRLAFTPVPAAGSQVLYSWYDTDLSELFVWDGSVWVSINATGSTGLSALTGDVTASGTGSQVATIAADAVTNAKLADMTQATVKGRAALAGTGNPTDLTTEELSVILDTATDPFGRTSYIDAAVAAASTGGASNGSFLVSGGQVAWESAYIYRISAAEYYINGTLYTSVETQITLDTADATFDRIDSIVLDTSSLASKVTGTAAAQPSEPDIDPGTQLKVSLVLVSAATSAPVAALNETVYTENAGSGSGEWNWTSSGSGWTLGSTNNPHAGSKDIEGTAVAASAYAQGEKGSGTLDPNDYDKLILFIRSKASWNNSRGLNITLRNAGVVVGAQIAIRRNKTYGFDSTQTAAYQQVAIPMLDFAVPDGSVINQVRITDFGGSIGFYIDDVKFQASGSTQTSPGLTQEQADARYVQIANAPATYNDESAQDAIGTILLDSSTIDFTYADATPSITAIVIDDSVTNAKAANMAADTIKGRAHGAGTGDPTDLTANQASAILDTATDPFLRTSAGGSGGITQLTGDVTAGPGSGSQAATLANTAVTPASYTLANITVDAKGRITAASNGSAGSGTVTTTGSPASGNLAKFSGATSIVNGDLSGDVTTSGTLAATLASVYKIRTVQVVIDGAGSAIATGVKCDISIPTNYTNFTITKWRILADQSGSIQFDLWADTYANFPPTIADTIVASDHPLISSATKAEGTSLTGWTTAIAGGKSLRVNVDSCTTITRATLILEGLVS